MRLSEYIKSNSLTDAEFAAKGPFSRGAVIKWRYGQRIPRPDQMRRISEVTDGQVTANDFFVVASTGT